MVTQYAHAAAPRSKRTARHMEIAAPVARALEAGEPVVALESTILAHGLPWPRNLETARAVEAAVRTGGAVPATIGILNGRVIVGLDDQGLEYFARHPQAAKASVGDVAALCSAGKPGATTVSATLRIAAQAGIAVYATGGIGGVHYGWSETLDVSADLVELATTPVAVVCSGAKPILDLAKTCEFMETYGVPIVGFGTRELPAFYTNESGIELTHSFDDIAAVARAVRTHWALGGHGAVLVAVPVPPAAALPASLTMQAVSNALGRARVDGVVGKAVTPFLLQHMVEGSSGRTLEANIALLVNNARVAADLACAMAACKED